jgi:hypothetical protein
MLKYLSLASAGYSNICGLGLTHIDKTSAKKLPSRNALAYFEATLVVRKKSFLTLTRGFNVIKRFFFVINKKSKSICQFFLPSLIFGLTRGSPGEAPTLLANIR